MKVYIVTSGEYSDYGIIRVFLDKEKAERYVELSQDSMYDEPSIEEWETDDDKVINEITYIDAYYSKDSNYRGSKLEVKIKKTNDLDSTADDHNHNYFWLSSYSGEKRLNINRTISGNYDEEKLKKKYEKVLYDLMAKIDSLISLEGWNEKMIQEWLGQNVDNYLK